MLTATELTTMQTVQTATLPSTCTIKRKSVTSDDMGGETATWPDLVGGVDVACRLAPVGNPSEQVVAERFQGLSLWMLTLPSGQDITHEDRVVIGSTTYEVAGLRSGGAWETVRRVLLAKVE